MRKATRRTSLLLCGGTLLLWPHALLAQEASANPAVPSVDGSAQPQPAQPQPVTPSGNVEPVPGTGAGATEQTASPTGLGPDTANPTGNGPAEIVVTATKRQGSVLKVPVTITAIGGDSLRSQGVNQVGDLANIVPSVNIAQGRDGPAVAIRGVTTQDTSSKGEQDIAFNVDGQYVGRGNARNGAFFDIERVEVLRGPQGTLYGRSSTGGAINIITVAPKLDEWSGYIRTEYGNYDTKRAEAALNVPVNEMIALRFSGAYNDRDGWSKPIDTTTTFNGQNYTVPASSADRRNDQKDATGRASLLFRPSDAINLRLTATIGHQGGNGNAPALETQLEQYDSKGSKALQILANPNKAFVDSNFQNFDGQLNVDLGSNVQLDVLGSHQHLHFIQQGPSVADPYGNPGNYVISPTFIGGDTFGPAYAFYYQDNHVKTDQVEARFSNIHDARINYVVGGNFFRESAGESGQSWATRVDDPVTPESDYIFQNGPVNTTVHKTYGVFGQATWNITDRLGIVGGVRYSHNEIQRDGRFTLPFNFATFPPQPYGDVAGNAICTYPNACLGDVNDGGSTDHKVTYRVGVNYQLTPANLFYASVATGFKGGTFNDYDPSTGSTGTVKPETVTAYEVGYKGHPFRPLTLTSSLFYYDFSKYQVTSGAEFPTPTGSVLTVVFTDTTPVQIYGWENELTYQIARQTFFNGSFSLLHSEFKNYQGGTFAGLGYPISYKGEALDLNPKFSLNAALTHSIDVGPDSKITLRVGTKYSASYLVSNLGAGVRFRQPSFTRSDASLAYDFKNGRYSIQLFVQNLENKVQRTSLGGYGDPYGGTGGSTGSPQAGQPFIVGNQTLPANYPANYVTFYTTEPRLFGVRLAAKF